MPSEIHFQLKYLFGNLNLPTNNASQNFICCCYKCTLCDGYLKKSKRNRAIACKKSLIFYCVPYNKRALLKKAGQQRLPQLLFSVGLQEEGMGVGIHYLDG